MYIVDWNHKIDAMSSEFDAGVDPKLQMEKSVYNTDLPVPPSSTLLPVTPPTTLSIEQQYEHYIRQFGSYSYILIILMGFLAVFGSLLIFYAKKIDARILRNRQLSANRCQHRHEQCNTQCECECEHCQEHDLTKDLPPDYQVALDMPKPNLSDYVRSNIEVSPTELFSAASVITSAPSHLNTYQPRRQVKVQTVRFSKTYAPGKSGALSNDDTAINIEDLKLASDLPSYEDYISSSELQDKES